MRMSSACRWRRTSPCPGGCRRAAHRRLLGHRIGRSSLIVIGDEMLSTASALIMVVFHVVELQGLGGLPFSAP